MKLCFFSRDKRTHQLFRSSWHLAALQCGIESQVVCREFGVIKSLLALSRFISLSRFRRVIFGTSEICLYAMFSRQSDVWVFTGLGRLIMNEDLTSRVICALLRQLYRGQLLVVLNISDREMIRRCIGGNPVVLEGEGYKFHPLSSHERVQRGLTFAYVGRLLKSKGVDQLVASFSRYSQPDWTLLLIGDSDFSNRDSVSTEELDNLANSSLGRIVCTGFRTDIHSLLRDVDVLVSLSRREGLPFSVLDGINAGVHLLLSPVPGHLSFDGLQGITFVESAELGIFFERFLDNPSQFLTFDRATRLTICNQKFGQEAIIKSIKIIFKDIGLTSDR